MKTKYYNTDLAFVHDRGHGQFAQHAAQTIWKLTKGISKNTLVVDLGCGSGILEKELENKELNIIGIDYSPAMIELATQNAPGAIYLTTSIYDFEIPECDLVCSIGECFNYLFDNKGDLNELRKLFANIHSALRLGGYFVFDILTLKLIDTSYANSRIIEQDSWTIFLEIEADRDQSILTRKITLFLKKEGCYKKSKETHRQKLYIKNDIETLLTDIGFEIAQINEYNGLPFKPGHIGFICKKN